MGHKLESDTAARDTAGIIPLPVLPGGASVKRTALRSRHPSWIKVRFSANERYRFVRGRLKEHSLHSVCEEAECPNIGECWAHGTATFMLLGDTCTRGCSFCAVHRGRPGDLDHDEPEKVAEVVRDLDLDYAVLTSVNRDDLEDEGAELFARTIEAIHRKVPRCKVEALVPDFHARRECLLPVVRSPLFVFAHNVETVPRLYRRVRAGSDYQRSLDVLRMAKDIARDSERRSIITKSSLMLGLGETRGELLEVFAALRAQGCDALTLGQYLRPGEGQLEVFRYVPPEEFEELRLEALEMGFSHVVSGPLVRSSYRAWQVVGSS